MATPSEVSQLAEDLRVRISVIERQVLDVEKTQEKLEVKAAATNNSCIENAIKIGNLDERQTKHAARHDSNYDKLDRKVDERFESLAQSIKNLTEQVNKMNGRDGVLRVIFGAFAGAVVVWVFRSMMGV